MQTLEMSGPAWVNIYYEEPHDFDLVFAGWGGMGIEPDGWLYFQFLLTTRTPGGYGTTSLDTLIDQGRQATTIAGLAAAYQQIGADFIETMPFMPNHRADEWHFKSNRFYHPLLDGLGTATSTANIDVLSVYVHSGQFQVPPRALGHQAPVGVGKPGSVRH